MKNKRVTPKKLVVVHVRGGLVEDVECPPGVEYKILDYDNCSQCGGADCEGGRKAVEIHGGLTGENQGATA